MPATPLPSGTDTTSSSDHAYGPNAAVNVVRLEEASVDDAGQLLAGRARAVHPDGDGVGGGLLGHAAPPGEDAEVAEAHALFHERDRAVPLLAFDVDAAGDHVELLGHGDAGADDGRGEVADVTEPFRGSVGRRRRRQPHREPVTEGRAALVAGEEPDGRGVERVLAEPTEDVLRLRLRQLVRELAWPPRPGRRARLRNGHGEERRIQRRVGRIAVHGHLVDLEAGVERGQPGEHAEVQLGLVAGCGQVGARPARRRRRGPV